MTLQNPIAVRTPSAVAQNSETARFAVVTLVKEPDLTATIRRLMLDSGISVYGAASPTEARELTERHPEVAIVVSDLHYDSVSGPDFYLSLRQQVPARNMAVVFLAAAASINDVISTLRLEAIDVLRKPPDPAQLIAAVRLAQVKLSRHLSERLIVQQAADILDASRSLLSGLSDSLQRSVSWHSLGDRQGAAEFDAPLDLPVDGVDVAASAIAARQRRRVAQHIKARVARRGIFGDKIAGNPCWDMLLDLFEKRLQGQRVSVTSVCIASGVPATTALRRLDELLDMGLVRRVKDENDARRILVELTPDAERRLSSYFEILG